ncbi:MAG: MFS transporter [Actinomycetes bacterium]|jgi:MFS family permease|nr:MFS transporter [Acidimicrobiia bacterium]
MTAVAPLKIGRFRVMWIASIFSNLGSFFYSVAASWLMLEMTGSATWVGLMQSSNTLPLLFLGLTAGALADLADRRRVMLYSQTLMGVAATAMAVLTFLDLITPPLLLGLGLVIGVGVAFNLPSWQAIVPNLVPRGMLASAVALNSAGFNVARAVGPALAGVVFATFGAAVAFGVNAASFIGVILAVALVGRSLDLPEPEQAPLSSAIALGLRFARFTPSFARLLALVAAFAVFSAAIQSVLAPYTDQIGGSSAQYGLLLGAMGVGALVAAFGRHRLAGRLGKRSIQIGVTVFGLAGVYVGLVDSVALAVPGLIVVGICWVLTLVTLNTTTQTLSPEWIRGRAMSLYTLAFTGITPLGAILSGALADVIGPGNAIAVMSAGTILLGLCVPLFRIPSLEEIRPPEYNEEVRLEDHPEGLEGGPVMVVNTWTIDAGDYEEFVKVMNRIRRVRLSTGAYRWRLYRDVGHPDRFSEIFLVSSWDEHLAQHRRIDDRSRALIRKARSFDKADGPRSTHLLAVDVAHPADWETMVAAHSEMHRRDGSVPLDEVAPSKAPES